MLSHCSRQRPRSVLPVVLFLFLALALYELNISPHGGLTVSVNSVHQPIAPELTRRPRDTTLTELHVCASAFEPPHAEKLRHRLGYLNSGWHRGGAGKRQDHDFISSDFP